MTAPYYSDASVTLYHGDCREITAWLEADVLVFDPPYGRGWKQAAGGHLRSKAAGRYAQPGIAGDEDTALRDAVLSLWGNRRVIVFGDPLIDRPAGTKQVLGYRKPAGSGSKGTFAGFLRDLELIYLVGPWTAGTEWPYQRSGERGEQHRRPTRHGRTATATRTPSRST